MSGFFGSAFTMQNKTSLCKGSIVTPPQYRPDYSLIPRFPAPFNNGSGNKAERSVMLTLKLLLPSIYTLTPRNTEDLFLGFLCVCVCVQTYLKPLCCHSN